MLTRSLGALGRRDVGLALRLPDLDDPVDALNKAIFRRAVEYAAGGGQRLDWALCMVLVARYLERPGDHAVDLGAQTELAVGGRS